MRKNDYVLPIEKMALSENLTERLLLRNFLHPLNREELDVGHRHPLGLQQQIPQVLIAPAAVNQHTNVPVHRFHHSEAYLRAAVVHYTFEVFEQHVGQFLKRRQPLPFQLVQFIPPPLSWRTMTSTRSPISFVTSNVMVMLLAPASNALLIASLTRSN